MEKDTFNREVEKVHGADCKLCQGTGIYFAPNGPDDYDKEPCPYD